jgi:hypothetical protein
MKSQEKCRKYLVMPAIARTGKIRKVDTTAGLTFHTLSSYVVHQLRAPG